MRRGVMHPIVRCLFIAAGVALVGCQKWTPVENPRPILEEQIQVDASDRDYFRFRTGSAPTVMGQVAAVVEDSVRVLTGSESETSVALDDRTLVELMGTDWVSTGLGLAAIVSFPVAMYLILGSTLKWEY